MKRKKNILPSQNLKLFSKQWLAGFFDGEGTICVSKHKGSFTLFVAISQTNVLPLLFLQNKFGGSMAVRKCLCLQWSHAAAIKVIKYLYPNLILKKKVANLAFDFNKLQGNKCRMKTNRRKYYKWVVNKRRILSRRISKLNHLD